MSIDKITKEHILDAVKKIESESIVMKPSTKYDVIINGKSYPPKEVMRYANFMANNTKEWTNSGGEPTNRYLKDFGFEIIDKNQMPKNLDTHDSMIQLLKKMGMESVSVFFEIADQIKEELLLKQGDERLTFGTKENKRFSITIGQRYCLAYIFGDKRPWSFISTREIPSTDNIVINNYEGSPTAYYYNCKDSADVEDNINEIIKASEIELSRTQISGYRKSNNSIFEKAIYDTSFRKQLFIAAFGTVNNLTGVVWKLGCMWQSGYPSFYEMIKSRSIVIGLKDNMYAPGDLMIITEGHQVFALGKILEAPKSVLEFPELKSDFEKYKIDYNADVISAKVEWYELHEDEEFTYKLTKGICKVNESSVRNTAFTIWNDRFINYWIFQGNPSEFDYETAVRNNLLQDWTVSAHKDKIKEGDKVILWRTGKEAGCYALAKVTSNPSESSVSADDHLWKKGSKIALKAGIEIQYNLLDNPLLKEDLKGITALNNLNVGNQGTNFTATRAQYNTLLKLIDNSHQPMRNKIDLSINTILYGPPGTGKTYSLNQYKKQFFIDTSVQKTIEEVLREKVPEYPFWKILAAVLNSFDKPVSVTELLANALVKAKINPDAKAPRSTVWRILQSYADEASTEMNEKYKGTMQLFQKNEASHWSIIPNKKQDLIEIVDEELLDMANNPDGQLVKETTSKKRFKFITFHQKYSYEDFIEGIKPLLKKDEVDELEGQGGDLQFELKKGIFYNSCLEALRLVGYESFLECYNDTKENRKAKFNNVRNNPSKQFALFIDEINRANISAVFGELITLLEEDKRIGAEGEMWIELPYSNEKFCVPANLYVIGTMNTADRSIALLDIALRRRFEFKALYPIYTEGEWWSPLLEALNQAIYTWKKNPDFFIGHAFFMNKLETEQINILNRKIIPLLYEYCQNNAQIVQRILSDAGVQIKTTTIKENFQIIAE